MSQGFEELLPDGRIARLSDMLRLAFPSLPDDTDFVSFINPAGFVTYEGETRAKPEEAVFALISDNPRNHIYGRKSRIKTYVAMLKPIWDREEREKAHYVGVREDPAYKFFYLAARNHAERLQNLRDLN